MARVIPNENTWIGFTPTLTSGSGPLAVSAASDLGASCKDLTGLTISINASSQGNTVPTPACDTLFETSVPGTSSATFTADFYRDDVATTGDVAWETLARGTDGFFIISRFGGQGTNNKPTTGDIVEVWPVKVTSRTMANMTSNTVLTFTVTCSVPREPDEAVAVAA